ncbi:MAG: hypothetical protein ISS34_08180 [Candidatus Omnitrophica bacterium]|nr:hypothetical protein [Candidatus Omnitrophota bacterium]
MEDIITALLLGLSWDRLLTCPFFTFGLSLSDRRAGARFLIGRIIGLVILGLIVTLLGSHLHIRRMPMNIIFGALIIILGVSMLIRRHRCKSEEHEEKRKVGGRIGFGLGLFRAMLMPGRKVVYLFPLLLGTKLHEGFIITLVYAISSSFYLALGFVSAEFLNKIVAYRKILRIAGAVILIILGAYYILRPCQYILR